MGHLDLENLSSHDNNEIPEYPGENNKIVLMT